MPTDKQKSIFSGLFSNPSQDQSMAMIQAGLSLLGPQRAGSSTLQNVAQAGAQGLNYLSKLETQRTGAKNEAQKIENSRMLAESQSKNIDEVTRLSERKTDQVDRTNQIRLFEAMTDRQKTQAILKQASSKVGKIKDETRQKVLVELIKQQTAKIVAGRKADPFEVASLMKLYLGDSFTMDGAAYDPATDTFSMYTYATDATDEDGKPVKEWIDDVSSVYLTRFGLNPKQIKDTTLAQIKEQKAKSVPDVIAEQNPNLIPTTGAAENISLTAPQSLAQTIQGFTGGSGTEEALSIAVEANEPPQGLTKIQWLAQQLQNLPQGTAAYPTKESALKRAELLLKSTPKARAGEDTSYFDSGA